MSVTATEFRGTLLLREWERWSGKLPPPVITALLASHPSLVELRLRPDGSCELQAKQWVGVGRFGGLNLRIVPKIPGAAVLALLGDEVGRLHLVGRASVGVAADLQELIGYAFVSAVAQLCRRGLRRDYVPREDVLTYARGRIDVRRTGLEHVSSRVKLACAFEDFEQDAEENRVLAYAVQRLLGSPLVFSAPLRGRAAEVLRGLPSPLPCAASVAGRLAARSRDPFYRAALRLAESVLRALGFSDAATGEEASGFWIDMNALFQAFVGRALRTGLPTEEYSITLEPQERFLDEERSVKVKPDVLVRHRLAELPIDAKYKDVRASPSSDVYQVLAYCRAFRSPAALIVVPGEGTVSPCQIHCRGGETVWTVRLDLRSRAEMANSAHGVVNLARKLLEHRTSSSPVDGSERQR